MDPLQGSDDQQLELHSLEQLQAIPRRLIGSAAERLVDHNKPEAAPLAHVLGRALARPKSELERQGRGQDGVGQLLLLPAGLAAGNR